MRKLLCLLLALVLVLGLSGCITESDLNAAYKKGRTEGYDIGYSDGLAEGERNSRVEYNRGYRQGLADGSPITKTETVYANAYSGYSSNKWGVEDSVYDDMYDEIYERGYEAGYHDARSEISDMYDMEFDY